MDMMTRWDPFTTSWDPFRDFETPRSPLSRFFGSHRRRETPAQDEAMTVAEWAPLVDIVEDDKEYLIKAELPEVKKEDVKINVAKDVLTLAGQRVMMKEEKDKKCHRIERAYGLFARSFTLPDDADPATIRAEFKEGLLKVHLPKTGKARVHTVDVKIG